LTGDKNINWHHALSYRNRQLDEIYAIQFLREDLHGKHWPERWAEMCAIMQGLEHLKINYPKFNWDQRLSYLLDCLNLPQVQSY
jgi:hypothetical protein